MVFNQFVSDWLLTLKLVKISMQVVIRIIMRDEEWNKTISNCGWCDSSPTVRAVNFSLIWNCVDSSLVLLYTVSFSWVNICSNICSNAAPFILPCKKFLSFSMSYERSKTEKYLTEILKLRSVWFSHFSNPSNWFKTKIQRKYFLFFISFKQTRNIKTNYLK